MLNQYILGDCLNEMPKLTERSVDLIFTSPPHISETKYKNLKDMRQFQLSFCTQMVNVIKKDGFIVICQANHRYKAEVVSNYALYYELLRSFGMKLKDEKIVYRRPPVGRKDLYRFTYQIMTIWTLAGGFKRSGDFLADTLIDEQAPKGGATHWTVPFCELVINALTQKGELVLDPFASSCPVLIAAKNLKRDFIGIEVDPVVHEQFKEVLA
jgi:DNA modification methylase